MRKYIRIIEKTLNANACPLMFDDLHDTHVIFHDKTNEVPAWEGCVLEFGDVSIVRADLNLVGDGELYFDPG